MRGEIATPPKSAQDATPAKRSRTSRSRSPSSPPTKRERHSPANASQDNATVVRTVNEWRLLHDRAVMALPPTAAVLASVLPKPTERPQKTLSVRVAAFDMDDTLIKYERKKVAASDAEDPAWEWLHQSVPDRLRALSASGFLLVLFSNQSTINGFKGGWNATKAASVQNKIVSLGQSLGLPLVAYVSTKQDRWRKPLPGMWGQLQEDLVTAAAVADGVMVDCHTDSFYVGDAAGRPAGPGKPKKDFSCGDRRFAHNVGLSFFTESEFLTTAIDTDCLCDDGKLSRAFTEAIAAGRRLSEDVFDWDGVSPDELRAIPASYAGLTVKKVTAEGEADITLPAAPPYLCPEGHSTQEMVILVGPPSTGKSTLYRRHFQPLGYVHVNRDTLGTKEKCVKLAEQMWAAGRSVFIDNTSPAPEDRRSFCDVVKRAAGGKHPHTLPIRFLELAYSKSLAMHLGSMRARLGATKALPAVAYHTFFSKYKPVTPEELKATRAAYSLRLPPVISFDDVPPQTRREFYLLS